MVATAYGGRHRSKKRKAGWLLPAAMLASSILPSLYNTVEGLIKGKSSGSGRRRRGRPSKKHHMEPVAMGRRRRRHHKLGMGKRGSASMKAKMARLRAMRHHGGAILTPGPLL